MKRVERHGLFSQAGGGMCEGGSIRAEGNALVFPMLGTWARPVPLPSVNAQARSVGLSHSPCLRGVPIT